MQIFRDLLSWFNLVPFLFTVLAAPSPDYKFTGFDSKTESVPDCAASPTVFIALPFQFWLEVILLKPYIGVAQVFEPSNPVKINWDYPSDRNDDFTYSKAEITSQTNTQLFQLNYNFLQNAKEHGAVLWAYDSEYFPGYKALAWDETGPYGPDGVTFLDFVAVKKCTSTNQTELILRAKESFRDDSTYFSRFEPYVHLWKNKKIMKSRSLPKSTSMG